MAEAPEGDAAGGCPVTAATLDRPASAAVRERPILFSGEMVCAIRDGRKTQTRRVVKPRREGGHISGPASEPGGAIESFGGGAWHKPAGIEVQSCPYGAPGDRLWVRETWNVCDAEPSDWPGAVEPGEPLPMIPKQRLPGTLVLYAADRSSDEYDTWRPSIHMPRWACRLTLEITGIRVERVQDISDDDCRAEGVDEPRAMSGLGYHPGHRCWHPLDAGHPVYGVGVQCIRGMRAEYASLWDSLNAKRGHSWESNPWVWVLEFRRIGGAS